MCGIAGKIGPGSDAVLARIHHRGPDSQGSTLTPGPHPVWLGHTRLAIQDLSEAGHQPMKSRSSRWWVTFNGEIYNHLELRNRLNLPAWRGHSDTETLCEALDAWGVDETARRLNGMFAFGAVDLETQTLHLVRDAFGIKPLYVSNGPDACFASRIDAVLELTGKAPQMDQEALHAFLALRYVPSPQTLMQGISRVPAGHRISIDLQSRSRISQRWLHPTTERFDGSIDDAVEAYSLELRGAIKRQLLSDVPVGILLSGGIDSALLAALASESDSNIPTFSVGYAEGSQECELDDAAETAQLLGLTNTAIRLTSSDLWHALQHISAEVEEPLGTTSILPMWHLVRRTKHDVTVALTGQGADEPWGGYRRYQGELLLSRVHRTRLAKRPIIQEFMAAASSTTLRTSRIPDGLRRFAMAAPNQHTVDRFMELWALFSDQERLALAGPGSPSTAKDTVSEWLAWCRERTPDTMKQLLMVDTHLQLADDLLLYGDKNSMAVALETRVPMLDTQLIKLIESFPISYRLAWGKTKIVHRRLAEQVLPAHIIRRKKKGFGVPFAQLARRDWQPMLREILFDGKLTANLDSKALQQVWEQHQSGTDRSRQLFALTTLALWLEHHNV